MYRLGFLSLSRLVVLASFCLGPSIAFVFRSYTMFRFVVSICDWQERSSPRNLVVCVRLSKRGPGVGICGVLEHYTHEDL